MIEITDLIKFTEYLVSEKIIFDEIPSNELLTCILKFVKEKPKTDGFILDEYILNKKVKE